MAKVFDQRALIDTPSKNVFNLGYRTRLSAIMGQLIPVLHKEVIPGDRWRVSMDSLIRLAPLKAPLFDGVHADFHAFFVPNRILDPKWKEFITDGNSLDVGSITFDEDTRPAPLSFDPVNYLDSAQTPTENRGFHISGLFDYLNLHFYTYNTDGSAGSSGAVYDGNIRLSALPVLGYHKIWSDWYRNERLEDGFALGGDGFTSLKYATGDDREVDSLLAVTGDTSNYNWFDVLHLRNYKKDRYTTALPEPCIGGPVMIPGAEISTGRTPVKASGQDLKIGAAVGDGLTSYGVTAGGSQLGGLESIYVQLTNAATATIQELKTAFKMYSFFMKSL